MARAPFQVLVLPFRRVDGQFEYAVLRRSDMDRWQPVAGGGEAGENPHQAAERETREELGVPRPVPLHSLETMASIPARFFRERDLWPAGTYVVPEYAFATDLTGREIRLSPEHTEIQWLNYQAALLLLHFDSNRTALAELHERLLADDLPPPTR